MPHEFCENHPASPAVVRLDWTEDYLLVCEPCILPALEMLHDSLVDMFVGRPVITVELANIACDSRPSCDCPDHGPDSGDGECFCTPECVRGDAIVH